MRLNATVVVAALLGCFAVAVLAAGALLLADRYLRTNGELHAHALALVPPEGSVLLEDPSQCSRTSWEGVFTLRDTCMEVRFSLEGSPGADAFTTIRTAALERGWSVVAEHNPAQLDIARPGYEAHVRIRAATAIDSCLASQPPSPPYCHHSIVILERD